MCFNRIALGVSFSLVIGFIVVPFSHPVNFSTTTGGARQFQMADGSPLPPLPPHASGVMLLADGSPLPPLPPNAGGVALSADGSPLPPLPPNAGGVVLLADGSPLPPLPPNAGGAASAA